MRAIPSSLFPPDMARMLGGAGGGIGHIRCPGEVHDDALSSEFSRYYLLLLLLQLLSSPRLEVLSGGRTDLASSESRRAVGLVVGL